MAWYDYIKGFFYRPPNGDRNEDVEELLEVLKSLSEDLLFSSESDYPFEVVSWEMKTEEINTENLNLYIGEIPTGMIESLKVEKLLYPMAKSRPYYSTERREQANRFKQIIQFFESQVTNAKAYKVGEIERDVYVIGKVSENYIIGLKSISVET